MSIAHQTIDLPSLFERRVVHVVPDPEKVDLEQAVAAGAHSTILVGDSREVLTDVPDKVFQCCVTSPPCWSFRDYQIAGQIGLEESLDSYLASPVNLFKEVHRVLKDDGTLWLNIGDSYTSGGRTWRAPDKKNAGRAMDIRPPTPAGLKPKDRKALRTA